MNKNNFLKDYIQVNERIIKFYEKYPEGSIQTHIFSIDDEKVVIKALAYRDKNDSIPCTGHAEEIRNSNYINRTNAVENCETSAVGRALANLGFEIKYSIASKEEIQQSIDKENYFKSSSLENKKRDLFNKASLQGIPNVNFKNICHDITNKNSSKAWTLEDVDNINSYLNSINTN